MLNLVRNAIDAMAEVDFRYGRQLALRTRRGAPGTVVVEVEDHGPGVHGLDEKEVFQPFRTTKSSGMGMGLSICRTIIDSHGGRLGFCNKTDSHGAVFQFQLPQWHGEQDT